MASVWYFVALNVHYHSLRGKLIAAGRVVHCTMVTTTVSHSRKSALLSTAEHLASSSACSASGVAGQGQLVAVDLVVKLTYASVSHRHPRDVCHFQWFVY